MTKKRALSPLELSAADALALALSRCGKTQEQVGSDVGVSQGMVWQWANKKLAVPARRARALARAVGVADPADISVDYRNLQLLSSGRGSDEPAAPSSASPLDGLPQAAHKAISQLIHAARLGAFPDEAWKHISGLVNQIGLPPSPNLADVAKRMRDKTPPSTLNDQHKKSESGRKVIGFGGARAAGESGGTDNPVSRKGGDRRSQ